MVASIFTLEQANRLLPLVRSITQDAVARYRRVKAAIDALEHLKGLRSGGAPVPEAAIEAQDARIARELDRLRRLIEELEALGCRLRDYDRGVVDFPAACVDDEGFVNYCWALGESEVSHWHSEHEGFEERRLVTSLN